MTQLTYGDFALAGSTKAFGANKGAIVYGSIDFHTLIEGLGADGRKASASQVRIAIRCWTSEENGVFSILPIIVQTSNGSISDSLNLSQRDVDEMLDQAITDEFGIRPCGKYRTSKKKNLMITTSPTTDVLETVELEVVLNKKELALLKKECYSERLQDLYLAFAVISSFSGNIYFDVFVQIDYQLVKKQITYR